MAADTKRYAWSARARGVPVSACFRVAGIWRLVQQALPPGKRFAVHKIPTGLEPERTHVWNGAPAH
ncbi:MAG: hypothetical protein ACYCOU_19170 [Sulfobacillus sp.]